MTRSDNIKPANSRKKMYSAEIHARVKRVFVQEEDGTRHWMQSFCEAKNS